MSQDDQAGDGRSERKHGLAAIEHVRPGCFAGPTDGREVSATIVTLELLPVAVRRT
jgi:hypothetical protein